MPLNGAGFGCPAKVREPMPPAWGWKPASTRYWARCSRDKIMLMGGHSGPIRIPGMADWGVREKMFFHNLSANPDHPEELALET